MNEMQHMGPMDHAAHEAGAMVMQGIPLRVVLPGVVGVILLSFVAAEWWGSRLARAGSRIPLVHRKRGLGWVRSRWFQAAPQLIAVLLLGTLVAIGLFGSRVSNLTPAAVWTLWWAGLIFTVLVAGSAWCFVCPWDGLANLVSRLRVAARVETLSLRLPYPKVLENTYPALILFALLTWLELGFGVTTDPRATAYLGIGMASLAVAGALLFEGKRFCAHFCPVGRICGIYSTFAPVEIRSAKKATCDACTTEDCLHGNELGYACPTGLSLRNLESSSMCTMCTECFKTCRKQNVVLNLRPFGTEVREQTAQPPRDQAWLAVALLALTLFHGLSMTSFWESFEPGRWSLLKAISKTLEISRTASFSLAMLVAVLVPIGLYFLACRVAAWWVGHGTTGAQLFFAFASSLLPVALFYHLAHNLMHLLSEGGGVVPLLSDPLGSGADWFGWRNVHPGPLASDATLWVGQVLLVVVGHVFGVLAAHRIAHRLFPESKAATHSLIPLTILMILLSVTGLSLMHLDMNMRMGRM